MPRDVDKDEQRQLILSYAIDMQFAATIKTNTEIYPIDLVTDLKTNTRPARYKWGHYICPSTDNRVFHFVA